ncbi:hypothetical protein CVT26_016097 [Gymnopilus dilepis]|uniref:Ribonucleotide reductase large subunit C-terminal domain-containing protein n=1 Tax=Gymnopilus dilepis TaxID=231916 RepID=A0A409WAD6_9AGAR|nr:hypothetical protein CVT26_016097 [Gymnopilus dilepis]
MIRTAKAASPSISMLARACTPLPQMLSTFTGNIDGTSIASVYDTITASTLASFCGGSVHTYIGNVPAQKTWNDTLYPVLKSTVDHLTQYTLHNRMLRPGAGPMILYIDIWHESILDVLELQSRDMSKSPAVFYVINIPDLFITRSAGRELWTLFDPEKVPLLRTSYGSNFDTIFKEYEMTVQYFKRVPAAVIWNSVLECVRQSKQLGIAYRDQFYLVKSNLNHAVQSQPDDLVASTAPQLPGPRASGFVDLTRFVTADHTAAFSIDFDHLHDVAQTLVQNLNRATSRNFFPHPSHENSFTEYRAVGLAITGLAQTFMRLGLPFDSAEAVDLTAKIAETLYHAGANASNVEANRPHGVGSCPSLRKQSTTLLSFQFWQHREPCKRDDWASLGGTADLFGLANADITWQPSGPEVVTFTPSVTRGVEPLPSNIIPIRVGDKIFRVTNPELVKRLQSIGIWNQDMLTGSVQHLPLPTSVKRLFRTAYEISHESIIAHAKARAPYLTSAQDIVVYSLDPTSAWLEKVLVDAWSARLKIGLHHVHTPDQDLA